MKKIFLICLALLCLWLPIFAQIPVKTLVQISRAEDELRFDKTLEDLMKNADAQIRTRAALASGRIGKESAIPALTDLLQKDSDTKVRAAAAFALGEIESIKGADVILQVLKNEKDSPEVRARAIEAAGKIAAAVSTIDKKKSEELGAAILNFLDDENIKQKPDSQTILLGITAILRAKPENGEFIAAKFLISADARVRADAANTMARLKAKNADEQLRAMLFKDKDAIARANAARAIGAAEDKFAFDLLLGTALNDQDARVRISSIRSLGTLKDARVADKLLTRAEILLTDYKKSKFANPIEKNELLEIAATLGRLLPNSNNERAVKFLQLLRELDKYESPETETALAKVAPEIYLRDSDKFLKVNAEIKPTPQTARSLAAGLGEFANLPDEKKSLREAAAIQSLVIPDCSESLRAFVKFKKDKPLGNLNFPTTSYDEYLSRIFRYILNPNETNSNIRKIVKNISENLCNDVFSRATIAELLGEQTVSRENIQALKIAFDKSLLNDKQFNDAQLAVLDALFKLDKLQAAPTLLAALNATDYLVRKKAFELLKDKDLQNLNSVKTAIENFTAKKKNQVLPRVSGSKLGQLLNAEADYVRAVSRRSARAILTTEKGTFTIEFFPEDAPLTVDNFIRLAKSNYFNGLTFHRVVPNFVVQDGDPRGDGNGGPGWEIRDEINMKLYERGAVGMALSGRDTGGSQWFVTHSPQPHLDGGYTVFGRVNETDMKIVDNLARGDKILSVKIVEGNAPQKSARSRGK